MSQSGARADRLDRLQATRVYLCCGPHPRLSELVAAVCASGVGAVQFRAPQAEWVDLVEGLAVMRAAAGGALLSVNDRADLAALTGSDILHVGQLDIPPDQARPLVGPDVLVGRSCHDEAQVEQALSDADVDYFCVGPTWPTPTKPGRPAPGLGLTRWVAQLGADKPWFAIGGIDLERLAQVIDAGATRAVVVRALTDAPTPAAAADVAAQLYEALATAAGPSGAAAAGSAAAGLPAGS